MSTITHTNPISGYTFKSPVDGVLSSAMAARRYTLPAWATAKQWNDSGSPVRKGETATVCVAESGFTWRVFNVAQTGDLPKAPTPVKARTVKARKVSAPRATASVATPRAPRAASVKIADKAPKGYEARKAARAAEYVRQAEQASKYHSVSPAQLARDLQPRTLATVYAENRKGRETTVDRPANGGPAYLAWCEARKHTPHPASIDGDHPQNAHRFVAPKVEIVEPVAVADDNATHRRRAFQAHNLQHMPAHEAARVDSHFQPIVNGPAVQSQAPTPVETIPPAVMVADDNAARRTWRQRWVASVANFARVVTIGVATGAAMLPAIGA